jgi:opacity protein-like surface antigen
MKTHLYSIAVTTAALLTGRVSAQDESSRAGKFEVFGSGQFETGGDANIRLHHFNIPVNYGDLWGGGAGFGYNIDTHWNVNGTANFGTVDAKTALPDEVVKSSAFLSTVNLNVDYNLFTSRLTPFLTAGIAIADYSDSVSSPGFSIDYFQTSVGVDGGAGVRWEFDEHWFVKAAYKAVWREGVDQFHGEMVVHTANVSVGYAF